MESNSSYQIAEMSNINGKSFLVHHTRRNDFCHFKVTPRSGFWVWMSKYIGPHSSKIILVAFLTYAYLLKHFDCRIGKSHIFAIFLVAITYLYLHYYSVAEENLICIKELGIQMSTSYFTGRTLQQFIPRKLVADCIINEVIYLQRIIFVLTILVSKTEDTSNYSENRYAKIERAVTLFKGTKPRLKTLECILKEVRCVFFEEDCDDKEL